MSNNDASAIHNYLQRHELTAYVRDMIGRPFMRPGLMKPHPHTVERALAIATSSASDTVLIGDFVSEIEVARATGVRSIGYAKTRQRGSELHEADADALTASMADLI